MPPFRREKLPNPDAAHNSGRGTVITLGTTTCEIAAVECRGYCKEYAQVLFVHKFLSSCTIQLCKEENKYDKKKNVKLLSCCYTKSTTATDPVQYLTDTYTGSINKNLLVATAGSCCFNVLNGIEKRH